MKQSLSAAEARRIFLNAQGLSRSRQGRKPSDADLAGYLARQGVLQLDTVNVLARAHYLPLFSRLGSYDRAAGDTFLWGDASGHSAHTFEHWGHEASVMPLGMLPAMHWRMVADGKWKRDVRERLESERPGLLGEVQSFVEQAGPVTSAQVEHLSPRDGKRGTWWDSSHVKDSLDLLFITGELASSRGKNFTRTYDATERAWGLPPASSRTWGLPEPEARQALFDKALTANGVGTPLELADHFRLRPLHANRKQESGTWATSAVDRGIAEWVQIEGWEEPALLAAGAVDPGRATGAALLSPFDPACWYRPRLERMFGMAYRIEIYTPAPKRIYGYYCLPFLLGDQMVGRIDLKADRKAGALRVESAWREERAVAGARRRTDGEIVKALRAELALMAGWLGLGTVAWVGRGNLLPADAEPADAEAADAEASA